MTPTPADADANLNPDKFAVQRSEVREGVTLAYVREGIGGTPLLLVHGYPETKRIWWRNIAPLVAGGDVGGPVTYDLSLRHPGFVPRLCFFNTVAPALAAEYEAAGIPPDDPAKLRASWGVYETSTGNAPMSEMPRYLETNPTPALVLYGPEDHVVPTSFPACCRVAFTECIGPFVVAGAGHFLQWEAAALFNRSLGYFFPRDLDQA